MSLSCDGAPVTDWKLHWNSVGPFAVDSWRTSYGSDAHPVYAHRVVGKHGFQLHTDRGCVIMFSKEYADDVCEAANAGLLARSDKPENLSATRRR
jgi:hypothetical protein